MLSLILRIVMPIGSTKCGGKFPQIHDRSCVAISYHGSRLHKCYKKTSQGLPLVLEDGETG